MTSIAETVVEFPNRTMKNPYDFVRQLKCFIEKSIFCTAKSWGIGSVIQTIRMVKFEDSLRIWSQS